MKVTDPELELWEQDSRACREPIPLDRKVLDLVADLRELRHQVRRVLRCQESDPATMVLLQELGEMVGYPMGSRLTPDPLPETGPALHAATTRLARMLSAEVEAPGTPWAFALFLYRAPPAPGALGEILQISRDRERTMRAVADWLLSTVQAEKSTRDRQ